MGSFNESGGKNILNNRVQEMMKPIFLAFATLALAAGAKQPDQIAATQFDDDVYARHSCSKLAAESLKQQQKLANLSAEQKSAANNDVVGVILIGLPTASISGNDKEAQISITKGRLQAIERSKAAKSCS